MVVIGAILLWRTDMVAHQGLLESKLMIISLANPMY